MSGPKRARVIPRPVRRVLEMVASAEGIVARESSTKLAELLRDTGTLLTALRRDAPAGGGAQPESADLGRLTRLREDLTLAVAQAQKNADALSRAEKEAGAVVGRARRVLSTKWYDNQVMALEPDLQKSLVTLPEARQKAEEGRRRVSRLRAELEAYRRKSDSNDKKGGSTGRGSTERGDHPARIAAELAARDQLKRQIEEVTAEPVGGWDDLEKWAGQAGHVREFRAVLAAVSKAAEAGDVDKIEAELDRISAHRQALEQVADANRASADRVRAVADAVMQALCDRHYQTPIFGPLREGDPLSGIRIRADVPGQDGRGNIRVDLHVDGRADFEVENVPTGEEEVCRSLIAGLAEAVASENMDLQVTDWGRAGDAPPSDQQKVQKREQVRERRRGDSGGGRA